MMRLCDGIRAYLVHFLPRILSAPTSIKPDVWSKKERPGKRNIIEMVCLGEMNTQETNITSDSQTSAEWDNSDCNISHWNDEQKLILDESIM
ncbi:hypothetical protein RRG08_011490 [Elysia crispata]|uniref:Uncharacterized protein n=1 Tax=Elysia crispata TaxID=231223 RepID=A0AAE1ED46_9GAST|nr:hypothetical protein RRG08_011490 [Elysia crispata]